MYSNEILAVVVWMINSGFPVVNIYNACRRILNLSDDATTELMIRFGLF